MFQEKVATVDITSKIKGRSGDWNWVSLKPSLFLACLSKTIFFFLSHPRSLHTCESWAVKKAECQRIDASKLWCWRRLLRVPWTARRSNQSILKEISPRCSLEGLMLKMKLQYFGHLMQRVDSLEKTLMLGGIGGRRRRGWQRMRWLDGITDSMDMSLSKLRQLVIDREDWRAVIHGTAELKMTELLNWTELFSSGLRNIKGKRGFKPSRTLQGRPGHKNSSMSPITCLWKRFAFTKSLSSKEQSQSVTN